MSEATITYVENPRPFQLVGSNHWLLGAYRVKIGDFGYMAPHTGSFIGDEPLHYDENFCSHLVALAEKAAASIGVEDE